MTRPAARLWWLIGAILVASWLGALLALWMFVTWLK
jgi:hypothetical protein